MTAAELQIPGETEFERILSWREEELRRAGYVGSAAKELATRIDVDLHLATDLLARGCSTELALEILL